jgi:hypothetical protein
VRQLVLQVSSGGMLLQPEAASSAGEQVNLGGVKAIYVEGISGHMEIVEGKPLDESGESGDSLEVWIHEKLAQKMGEYPGEVYNVGLSLEVNLFPFAWLAGMPSTEGSVLVYGSDPA